jgi:hypothetical protein
MENSRSFRPTSELEEVREFLRKYGGITYSLESLDIEGFIRNNSYVILRDKDGELSAFCIWNMDGTTGCIEEVVIHPKYREQGLLYYIAMLGWQKFPYATHIRFCRGRKYQDKAPRVIDLVEFIRRKSHGRGKRHTSSTTDLPASTTTYSD